MLEYLSKVKELQDFQTRHINEKQLTTQEYANNNRRGLRVVSYKFVRQYESYCLGVLLHSGGYINEALRCYSSSLQNGGKQSNNLVRLQALQAIELIIREKQQLQQMK